MNKRKILLIEDDSIVQMVISDMLGVLNCAVDIAGTGEEALKLTKDNRYDIIFMDLGLPDIDGTELSLKIRAAGYLHPIVACTGRTKEAELERCLNAKINGFLQKPVDIATLRDTLNKYLDIAGEWLKGTAPRARSSQ